MSRPAADSDILTEVSAAHGHFGFSCPRIGTLAGIFTKRSVSGRIVVEFFQAVLYDKNRQSSPLSSFVE